MNQIIGGYRLVRKLGQGAMGAVYAAIDDSTGRRVALKVISSQLAIDPSMVQRFKREILVCKKFAHPYVIKIIDGGIDEATSTPYLAMELLNGTTLNDLVDEKPLDEKGALNLFLQQSEALEYIHSQGILHRDIKPDNIFILFNERSVLLDFGLVLMDDKTRISRTSDRPGTMLTMSPEQLQGEELAVTSDIYNLGMTMYIAVTGKSPYGMSEIVEIASGIGPKNVKGPAEINRKISGPLSKLIMYCIRMKPEERFQTASKLKNAIHSVLDGNEPEDPCPGYSTSDRSSKERASVGDGSSVSISSVAQYEKISSTSKVSNWENRKIVSSRRLVISFMAIVLCCGMLWGYLRCGGTGTEKRSVIQGNAHPLVELSRKILLKADGVPLEDIDTIDPHALLEWMKKVSAFISGGRNSYSGAPKGEYDFVLREVKKLSGHSQLERFIEAEELCSQGLGFQAIERYRQATYEIFKTSYLQNENVRISNGAVQFTLSRICNAIVATKVIPRVSFTPDESMKWFEFRMFLPYASFLSDDALFLRMVSFVNWSVLVSDRINSPEFNEETGRTLGNLLRSAALQALSPQYRTYIESAVAATGIPPVFSTTTEIEPHLQMGKIVDELSKSKQLLMNSHGAKLYYQQSRDFFRFNWLMYADMVIRPQYIRTRASRFYSGQNTPQAFKHHRFWIRFHHIHSLERLRFLKFLLAAKDPPSGFYRPYLTISSKRRNDLVDVVYTQASVILGRFKGTLSAEDQFMWESLSISSTREDFDYWMIQAHIQLSRQDFEGAVRSLERFVDLIDESTRAKDHAQRSGADLWRLHRLVCVVLSELFRVYPERFSVDFLTKIPQITERLAKDEGIDKYQKINIDDERYTGRKRGWLRNMDLLASFTVYLNHHGASISDLNVLTNNIHTIYATDMNFDELGKTLRAMSALAPVERWKQPFN